MEYESRQVKWYWLLLFILFCGGVGYLLFTGNPYLYSHLELRSVMSSGGVKALRTIPSKPTPAGDLGEATYYSRYGFSHTAVDPFAAPRSRSYEEYEHHEVDFGMSDFDVRHIVSDDSGFYVSGKSPWVFGIGLDGKARWRYKFLALNADQSVWPVLLDSHRAYLIHPAGEVVCLDKDSGELLWVMDLKQEVAADPFLWKENIVVPVKGASGVQMFEVHRGDGRVAEARPQLDLKPGFQFASSPALAGLLIATVDNKVVAVDPQTWKIQWSQTLTDPIRGAAMLVDKQIFVSTLGAKIIKLDGGKKGKVEWETDLEKPAASPPTYLPIMHRLSVLTTTGVLIVVDAKTGKLVWRAAIDNRNPLMETWSARLKGQNIEEFKMDWLHKGWSIWSPCAERRFCLYTPGKGQLMQRVTLSGLPMTLPLAGNHRWVFFLSTKKGHYAISQVLEENDIKKLKAEAAKSQAAPQSH
jgi:hypothetical protein